MAGGAYRAHQHVDVPQLFEQLEGQRPVGLDVVGVVVLVGAVRIAVPLHELADPVQPGLLPTSLRVRRAHHVHLHAVGAQQPVHDRFHARVGDDCHGVVEHDPRQRQPKPQRATGGLDDRRASTQLTPLASAGDHVQGGTIFEASGVAAFELGPEAAWAVDERSVDP